MRNSWGDKINTHTHTAETLSCSVWWQAVMALYSSRWSLRSLLLRSPQWLLSSNLHTHTNACAHKTFTEAQGHLKYQQHVPSKRKQTSLHWHITNMLTQEFLHDIASLNLSYEVISPCFAHVRTWNGPLTGSVPAGWWQTQ